MTPEQREKMEEFIKSKKPESICCERNLRNGFTAAIEMQSAEAESGCVEKHEAHRYRQIHEAVEKMGGWANYSYWAKRHSVEYFKLCENQEAKIAQLQQEIERLKEYEWKYKELCK